MTSEMEQKACVMHYQYKTYGAIASTIRTPCAIESGHNVRMTTPRDRLRKAREDAGFKTPTDAARAHRELNANTLISNENGNRDISRTMAVRYGKAFGVDPGWLLYGTDKAADKADMAVPLLAMVSAGNLRDQAQVAASDVIRRITVGELTRGDWVALQVEGDSMDRVAPHGSIIVLDRTDTRLLDGKYYVFVLENGEATFKRYRRNPQRLQPFSTNPDHLSIPADRDDLYVFGRVRRIIQDV